MRGVAEEPYVCLWWEVVRGAYASVISYRKWAPQIIAHIKARSLLTETAWHLLHTKRKVMFGAPGSISDQNFYVRMENVPSLEKG